MQLLLISNSKAYGQGYLDHVEVAITDLLGEVKTILFIPYALSDLDSYAKTARDRFGKMGINLTSIHNQENKHDAIKKAEAFFVGGGNTFLLLDHFYRFDLLGAVRQRVLDGVPYIGTSAGANLAGPTIKTTNDMPIVWPKSLTALNLVPFQINPHYIDTDPNSKHMGESREQRIREFHEANETPVIGLREGSWLVVDKETILQGKAGARVFRQGQPVEELPVDKSLRLPL